MNAQTILAGALLTLVLQSLAACPLTLAAVIAASFFSRLAAPGEHLSSPFIE